MLSATSVVWCAIFLCLHIAVDVQMSTNESVVRSSTLPTFDLFLGVFAVFICISFIAIFFDAVRFVSFPCSSL